MVAALPHCDALVSGHSFEALQRGGGGDRRGWQDVPEVAGRRSQVSRLEPEPEEETWASATPVPGSSVAMPSGYGPSRGKTTPGWSLGE